MATKADTIRKRLETIASQSAALNTKLNELADERVKLQTELVQAEANAERDSALANGLPVGTPVTFTYGRAESKRTLQGVVKASKATDAGRQYKIESGEGFDSELYTVLAGAISDFTLNPTTAVPPVGNAAEENLQ